MKKIIIGIIVILVIGVGALEIYFSLDKKDSTNEVVEEVSNNVEEYYFTYNGVDIKIGDVFDETIIDEEYNYSEITSCAFEGIDKVYTYENFEITAYEDGDVYRVYSIYFLNDEVETNEGLKITDEEETINELYGSATNEVANAYYYEAGNTSLDIIVANGMVISIQYTLITD